MPGVHHPSHLPGRRLRQSYRVRRRDRWDRLWLGRCRVYECEGRAPDTNLLLTCSDLVEQLSGDDSFAVILFNRSEAEADLTITWEELGLALDHGAGARFVGPRVALGKSQR